MSSGADETIRTLGAIVLHSCGHWGVVEDDAIREKMAEKPCRNCSTGALWR